MLQQRLVKLKSPLITKTRQPEQVADEEQALIFLKYENYTMSLV